MASLSTELFDRVVALLIPFMSTEDDRKTEIYPVVQGKPVFAHIQWEGKPKQFTVRLVDLLPHDLLLLILGRLTVGEDQRQGVAEIRAAIEREVSSATQATRMPFIAPAVVPPVQLNPEQPNHAAPDSEPAGGERSNVTTLVLALIGGLLVLILGIMTYDRLSSKETKLTYDEYEKVRGNVRKEVTANSGLQPGPNRDQEVNSRVKRQFGEVSIETKLWPEGLVPFETADGFPDEQMLSQAIAMIEGATNVRFVRRIATNTAKYPDFVRVRAGDGCSSMVGKNGGAQPLIVGPECEVGSVVHELLHALGLYHEHARSDRDKYVRIAFENVVPAMSHNFDVVNGATNTLRPYDYESIMHFPATAFSINGKSTIQALLPNITIGGRDKLSPGDVLLVNALYPTVPTIH